MSRVGVSVSVGLPTFNRAGLLRRAIDSVLSQSHRNLELVISDNASTDGTRAICESAAERDTRVRYLRQSVNRGLTENFNTVLRAARGRYVMVLADDDWLDRDYVARCVAALEANPDHVVVSGRARFYQGDAMVGDGVDVDLLNEDPVRRVRCYFGEVRDNASIYGLMRCEVLESALPMRNCLAGDWLLIARLAMVGKVRTLPETWVNRSAEGASASYRRTVRSMGLTKWESRHPHLAIAGLVFDDVAVGSPMYDRFGRAQRFGLGLACSWAVLRHRPFNIVEDALAPYLRRPRLQWIDRTLRPLVQRIQR
jgi:glycosyltransferase involved in cell wall biosynthesis